MTPHNDAITEFCWLIAKLARLERTQGEAIPLEWRDAFHNLQDVMDTKGPHL